jgi:transcriptional regulator with XRE-family HTH domain
MSTRFTNYLRKKRENPEFRKREKIAEVAAELRIQISSCGLNQHQLAEKLRMSDQALSKKLSGTANLTIGAMFDLFEAMGKDFELVARDKGIVQASSRRELITEMEISNIGNPFVVRKQGSAAARSVLIPEAANDGWGTLPRARA